MVFPWCFIKASCSCFKEFSKKFQGSFKSVSRMFCFLILLHGSPCSYPRKRGLFLLIFPSTGWSSTVPLSKWFIYCKYLFKWFPILHYWVRCPNLILLILFYPTYSVWHINSQYITGVGCKGGGGSEIHHPQLKPHLKVSDSNSFFI